MRKLCVVTGTRAEYGLLKHLIKAISASKNFKLQLIVTGSHLSKHFGYTYREIEGDGFHIDKKIDIDVRGDKCNDTARSTALSIEGFSKSYADLKPDLLLLLGDRYELLGAAISAMIHRVPIAHLHGGEVTVGAMDEGIRHAITKFSHIHFVAAEEYKSRVIQLGENPKLVFNVGGFGVDAIRRIKLLSKKELEDSLGFRFKRKNLLITFHPVTLDHSTSVEQMSQLLSALLNRKDTQLIFTMPNADTGSKALFTMIENFVKENENSCLFVSLGQLRYFSCLAQLDAVIGNSSSGLLEVPSFKKVTINIGDRQKGRLMASSVINCKPIVDDISNAITQIYNPDFQETVRSTVNPYGEGGAVEKTIDVLERLSFEDLLKKDFYNL